MSHPDINSQLDYLPELPRDRRVPIGCIGAGFIMADCHLVAYKNAGFQPVAIASRSLENAKKVGNRHNIPMVYEDYRKLLKDPHVEILDVAVQKGPHERLEVLPFLT